MTGAQKSENVFKLKIILFCLGIGVSLWAPYPGFSQKRKIIIPKITSATLFLNKAQISSQAFVGIEAGATQIVLKGLPASIDPASIQVSGSDKLLILAVKYEPDYLQSHEKPELLAKLEDSLRFFKFQLGTFLDFEDVLRKEEVMLIANQEIGGKEKTLDADDLEYFANFFRKRLLDLRFQILKNKQDIVSMTKKVTKIENQIAALGSPEETSGIIQVLVESKVRTTVSLGIDYVVTRAGWKPLYDFRVKGSEENVDVVYKAQIRQLTGIDWENVNLKLSTYNPALGATKPELEPWYLNLSEPVRKRKPISLNESIGVGGDNLLGLSAPTPTVDSFNWTVQTVETSLAVEFPIDISYTIPSGESGQTVEIKSFKLPAVYQDYTAPKLVQAAYLVGRITDFDDKNLISGPVNIYSDGNYVGETFLDMNSTEDTLDLSLGRDNRVTVERVPIKEFRKKGFLGNTRTETFAYRINIRNQKEQPVTIVVEDQIPVSQTNQIVVDMLDVGDAQKNDSNGVLMWKLSILPGETQTLEFKYFVKYPKSRSVIGLH